MVDNIGIMEKQMETTIQGFRLWVWWTPHPVIVAKRDTKDHIRVLVYSYYTYLYYRVEGVLRSYYWYYYDSYDYYYDCYYYSCN